MSTAAVNPRCFPIPASSICGSLSQHSSNSLLSFDGSQASGVFNSLRLTLPANLSAGVFGSAADLDWALEQTLPSSTAATSTADTAFTQWNCQHQQVQLMQKLLPLRYQQTIICALIAAQSKCNSDTSPHAAPICAQTTAAFFTSISNLVNSSACSLITANWQAQVAQLLNSYGVTGSTASSCLLGVDKEASTCGFNNINTAKGYCSSLSSPSLDSCCAAMLDSSSSTSPNNNNPSTSSPNNNNSNSSSSSSSSTLPLSTAALAGICIGCLSALILIIVVCVLVMRKRRLQQRSSSNNSSSGKSVERSATIPSTTAISEDLYRQNPFSPGDDSLSSFIKISSTSSSSPAVAADVATPVIHVSSSSSSRPFILNVGDQNRGSSSLGRESVLSSSSSSSLLATQQQQQQQHNTLAITQDPFATPPTVKGVAFLAIAAAAEEEDGENSISTLPTIPTQSNSTIVSPFYSELDDTVTPNLLNNNNNMTSSTTLSTSSSPLSLNIFKRSSSSTSLASSSAASGQQQQKSGRRSAIISSKDAMHLASLFRTELVRAVSFKSDSSGDISNIGSK